MRRKVLVLSDVTVGYAVPQMILMARSLGELLDAKVVFVEPDMKSRRELIEVEGIEFRRVSTRNPPHDLVFHVEYVRAMREIYQEVEPDVLVVFNAAVLPPLLLESKRPEFVLYYMLESLDHQLIVGGQHFYDMNRMATEFIDLVVVPERRRHAVDSARLGWETLPFVEVFNIGSEIVPRKFIPNQCRFLFAGTLNRHTGFDWLADERLRHLEIHVAGPTDSEESRALLRQFLERGDSSGDRQYLGLLPHRELLSRLHDYAFRLVFWTATDINTVYASPNKFFESISYGLPPVSTPHPQMREINDAYRCSVLSTGFTKDEMVEALLDAERIFQTNGYLRLLKGCWRAANGTLNWTTQFEVVAAFLSRHRPLLVKNGIRKQPHSVATLAVEDYEHALDRMRPIGERTSGRVSVRSESSKFGSGAENPLGEFAMADLKRVARVQESFDAEWYMATYPDVAMLGMTAEEHFDWIGRALGRSPNADSKNEEDIEIC